MTNNNMSNNQKQIESDIPGFYYDSIKKKYYRITPAHNSNALHPEKIRRIEGHRESIKVNEEIKKTRIIPLPKAVGLFQSAGPSHRSAQSLQRSFLTSTMAQLSKKFSSNIQSDAQEYPIRDVLLSVPAYGKICSAFSMKSGGSIVYSSTIDFSKESMDHGISNIYNQHKVVDIKPVKIAHGDFAGHACQALRRSNHFVSIRPLFQDPLLDDHSKTYEFPVNETIWSLALTSTHVAVGKEKEIERFSMTDNQTSSVKIPGENVFALENDGDDVLVVGSNKGNVHFVDVRSQKIESTLNAGAPVSNLKVSANHLVVGGYDHKLKLFDKRNQNEELATFAEHQNDCRPHLGLQLNENLKVLAASGSDNVIRIWSLTDFKLSSTLSDEAYVRADSAPCFVLEDSWGPPCAVAVVSEATISCYS